MIPVLVNSAYECEQRSEGANAAQCVTAGETADNLLEHANNLFLSMGLKVSDHQGVMARCPTGECYIILQSTGERTQGDFHDQAMVMLSQPEAAQRYLDALKAYATGKTGTVYWRQQPEVEPLYHGWTVYSRLLISDKPVIADMQAA